MATTKRVLWVAGRLGEIGGGWTNWAASGSWRGAGQVSDAGGGEQLSGGICGGIVVSGK